MLERFGITDQPNVTIAADPGPRTGDGKIKEFAGIPLSWIPDDLGLQRRRSPLRLKLRRGSLPCAPTIFGGQRIGVVAQG